MNLLIELGTKLALDQSPGQLLEDACHSARAIVDAESAALGVLDETGCAFRYHFLSGGEPADAAQIVSPALREGFLGEILAVDRPVRVTRQCMALLGVPIVSTSRVYGVLYFIGKPGAEAFSDQDERLAITVASKVAIAYENTIRCDDLQRQAAVLRQEVAERQHSEEQVRALNDELDTGSASARPSCAAPTPSWSSSPMSPRTTCRNRCAKAVSFTQLLAESYKGRLDSDADGFIACAVDGATRMQQLIRDLLNYSRVGAKPQAPRPTDCEPVLERSLANLQLMLQERNAIVTHDPLPTVAADEKLLVQVLQNLIGNAVKFNRAETPRVHIHSERQGEEWIFAVRDNGIGIDPQFKERIFVLFKRLHSQSDYPGTGIGLAICKKAIERLGGQLWVDSELGKGATFYFTIPACKDAREIE